ncbi:MAG: hypothetical protein DRO18_03390 [Thermoprotei archaeon]|nr:MAG: hypothetical protein DRO18_03390 [Thermoprotei archaeon]
MPDWGLVDSRKSDVVLAGNPIHTGRGVEMIVEKAVDKTLEIFDNWDDYKARVREHVDTYVKNKLTWEIIGKQLAEIISSYV